MDLQAADIPQLFAEGSDNYATTIKVRAECRLADLVDEGQARGKIATPKDGGRPSKEKPPGGGGISTYKDLGLDWRRLAEARLIRDTYTDADIERLRAEADAKDRERDENTCRLDMKPSEFVALGRKLEEMERSKAKERQSHGETAPGKTLIVNYDKRYKRTTQERVGKALGVSGSTYERSDAHAGADDAPGALPWWEEPGP